MIYNFMVLLKIILYFDKIIIDLIIKIITILVCDNLSLGQSLY